MIDSLTSHDKGVVNYHHSKCISVSLAGIAEAQSIILSDRIDRISGI